MNALGDRDGGAGRASEASIYGEFLAARKRPAGLSPHVMAQCPTLCALLGNGDPEVAHVELCHKVFEILEAEDDTLAIEAACYSLGLASDAATHLAWLEEFGAKHFVDQRQARRYSDRGLAQLARLVATHWTTQTVPEASLICVGSAPNKIGVMVHLKHQHFIDMQAPKLGVWPASKDEVEYVDPVWKELSSADGLWAEAQLLEPYVVDVSEELTVRLVWRGETWPTFIVALSGDIDAWMVKSQTLGAACAVTFTPG